MKLPKPAYDLTKDYRWNRQLRNIFPNNPELWHCTYVIGDNYDIREFRLPRLYAGESGQPLQRWWDHGNSGKNKEDRELFKLIKKHGWTFEQNMLIIGFGSKEQCLTDEAGLRPVAHMGLNLNPGGRQYHRHGFEKLTYQQAIEMAENTLNKMLTF